MSYSIGKQLNSEEQLTDGSYQLLGENQSRFVACKRDLQGCLKGSIFEDFEGELLLHSRSSRNTLKQLKSEQTKITLINCYLY